MPAVRRVIDAVALAGSAALAFGTVAGAGAPVGADRIVTVRVTARDFAFALSKPSVVAGSTVRFAVRNDGATVHDFVIKGKRTRVLRPGQRQAVTVAFPKRGTYRFLCSVPGHVRLGMKGSFGVSTTPSPQPLPSPTVNASELVTLSHIGTFERPVLATAPPGDDRLFVVEQAGAIRVVREGQALPRPFLDLRENVKLSSEPGFLSLAFAPDYEQSGLFYVFYNSTAGNGDIRISEFHRHATDPDLAERYSERILLTIPKPWENHNGGMLQFGPDGYLYAAVGDGDSGVLNPPGAFAQRRDELLGSILRIDPRSGDPYAVPDDNPFVAQEGVRPEIWAYGLRNPWRFWIDHETRTMLIGDPGPERREEVDIVRPGESGINFGWPCFEGSLEFDLTATCADARPPLLEYPRADSSCAVIGGVVIRDPRLEALTGRYLYGDFCGGWITTITFDEGRIASSDDLGLVVPELTSFGVDGTSRIYVMSLRGDVFRVDPKPE